MAYVFVYIQLSQWASIKYYRQIILYKKIVLHHVYTHRLKKSFINKLINHGVCYIEYRINNAVQ